QKQVTLANSIEDGTDLFSEEDSFSFLEKLSEEDSEGVLKEPDDLVNKNLINLKVRNFISLLSRLEPNESSSLSEDVIHRDKDFDINKLIDSLD
ncbi:11269_t:CDS:2, partial [Scutellospora calospora]